MLEAREEQRWEHCTGIEEVVEELAWEVENEIGE